MSYKLFTNSKWGKVAHRHTDSSAWVNACKMQLALETHLPVCLSCICTVELEEMKLAELCRRTKGKADMAPRMQ